MLLKNVFDDDAPLHLSWDSGTPDEEGWCGYHMALVAQGNSLLAFDGTLSTECIELLTTQLADLLASRIEEFDYEPLEPAFQLQLLRLDDDSFNLLCIVDISYINQGPATETGIGLSMVVNADNLQQWLTTLQQSAA